MKPRAYGTWRAARLLAGLRLRRLRNLIAVGTLRRFVPASAQAGTARRSMATRAGIGWLAALAFTALMTFSFGNNARLFLLMLSCREQGLCDNAAELSRQSLVLGLHAVTLGPQSMHGLAFLLILVCLFSAIYPFLLAARTGGPEWDFEWIATLPMSRTALVAARIVERGLINPLAWFLFGVCCALIAWYAHARWLTALETLLVTAPLLLVTSTLWTALDLGLHVRWSPPAIRNVHALMALLIVPLLFVGSSLGMPATRYYTLLAVDAAPAWIIWTPPGLAVQILCAPSVPRALACYALLLGETAFIAAAGVAFVRRQLRFGLAAHGERESGRPARARPSGLHAQAAGRVWLPPLIRRELTLMLRDRRYLMQCFGVPLAMIALQCLLNRHLGTVLLRNPAILGSAAFGLGAYTLLLSTQQSLAAEGERLWLLYTFPRPLGGMLWEKTRFYAAATLPWTILPIALSAALSPAAPLQYTVAFVFAIAGLLIHAVIAQSLCILSGVPTSTAARLRNSRQVYLYMLSAAFYAYALYSHDWWIKCRVPLLSATLAYALWQKSNDRLPTLLDPAAAPPARVSLADGLIATILFFALQAVCLLVLRVSLHLPQSVAIVLAYLCAGGLVYLFMRAAFWGLGTAGVPRILAPGAPRALAEGCLAGLLCAGLGLVYLWAGKHYGLPPAGKPSVALPPGLRAAVVLLAVGAAPLFEEFIFRGLIFGGLRRSLHAAWAALGSAALFALVHPPYSMLPVFVLGLMTAWVYERRRMLLASMAAHAVYNALVVGYQLFMQA